jgi:hypothetical protein
MLLFLFSRRHALLIQLHLKINRSDIAQKQLKTMKGVDEDSVLTMLATAWVNMSIVSIQTFWTLFFFNFSIVS